MAPLTLVTLGDVTLLSRVYTGDVFKVKREQQLHATVTIVLALATLGGMTQTESFLSYVAPPKVAVKGIEIIVNWNLIGRVSLSPTVSLTNFPNVNDLLGLGLFVDIAQGSQPKVRLAIVLFCSHLDLTEIHSFKTFSTLIKAILQYHLKALALPPSFN